CQPLFDDVTCAHGSYGEVRWLVDHGIADGYADGTFRPTAPVSRQAAVAFLHRRAGSPPGPTDPPPYVDVPDSHAFAEEIAWAAGAGIIDGYPDGTFRPTTLVSRQAMA